MNNNTKTEKINTKEQKWEKPSIKTISYEELKKVITVSACSEFDESCPRYFFR